MDANLAGICLIVLYVLYLSLPEGIYTHIRSPLSLRYFVAGVLGLAALATAWFGEYSDEDWKEYLLLGMFYLSPLWFSIGARRSLAEPKGHRAKMLRSLNVAGLAVLTGLITMILLAYDLPQVNGLLGQLAVPGIVVLGFSGVVLWQPPTRFRWARFLPGFPALLLMIAILGLWAGLCFAPRKYQDGAWYIRPKSVTVRRGEPWGFPFVFAGGKKVPMKRIVRGNMTLIGRFGYGFRPAPLLADLVLALAAGYIFAMAVDRLVFPAVRRARGKKLGQGEAG